MALPIQMNKMLPSGAALGWASTCKVITDNVKVAQNNLTNVGSNGGLAVKTAVDQGSAQSSQIEHDSDMMYSQGAAGLAGACIGLAIEAYFLGAARDLDAEADEAAKQEELDSMTLSEGGAPPPSSSTSASTPDEITKSGTIAKPKEEEEEAELTKGAPASSKGSASDLQNADLQATAKADEEASADLTKAKVTARKEQDADAAAVRDGVKDRANATSANKESAETLRGKANSTRQTGSSLSQLANAFCSSIGTIVGAYYKNLEAADQEQATIDQGLAQMYSSMMEVAKDGLQAAESAVSGAVQALSTAAQASAAGYRG